MNIDTCEPENACFPNNLMNEMNINYTPEYAMQTFLSISSWHKQNPLTDAFFSMENVLYIISEIRKVLKILSKKNVNVVFSNEMLQTLVDTASHNLGLSVSDKSLDLMNYHVIKHESNILYNSLIRRNLWIKYYLQQDRMKVFPRAEMTKVTKGESVVCPSGYMLSNPWSRHRDCYLHDTEGIRRCKETSEDQGICGSGYERIKGFLEPKK